MNGQPVKIAIGNANGGAVHAMFAASLAATLLQLDSVVGYLSATSPIVSENRNILVDQFFQGDADRLLFIDSDVAWQPWQIEALAALAAPAVAGLCFTPRGGQVEPAAWNADGTPIAWRDGGLVHAAYTGCAFLLLTREILAALRDKHGHIFDLDYRYDDTGLASPTRALQTEDTVLCRRLHQIGVPAVVVDTSTIVEHYKSTPVQPPGTPA
jgi:hypothetical protein